MPATYRFVSERTYGTISRSSRRRGFPVGPLEQLLLALGLGLAALVLLLFFLGVAGLYKAAVFGPLLLLLAAIGGAGLWADRRLLRPSPGWLLGSTPLLIDRLLLVAVGLFGGLVALAVNAPELAFDSLVYHLAVPSAWIRHGGIQVLPHSYYSNLPMSTEMLYTGALLVGDEQLCRMLHGVFGLLSGLAVFAMGRRWLGRRVGLWGAALYLTVPLLALNMATSGSDTAAGLFTILALSTLLVWSQGSRQDIRRSSVGLPLLAGLLIGAALSCKYNTVFGLAPMVAAAAGYRLLRRTISIRRLLSSGALIAGGCLVLLSPWLGKNLVFTGNPVCPFLAQQLPTRHLHLEKIRDQMAEFREYHQRGLTSTLRQPWDLSFFEPTSNSFLGIVFLFLLPAMLIAAPSLSRRGPPVLKLLMLCAVAGTLAWASKTQIARYLIPVLPLLSLLSAAVLQAWETARLALRSSARAARVGVLLLVVWGWATTLTMVQSSWDPVGASLGLEPRATYLHRALMLSYQAMVEATSQLPADAKILAFGETRSLYFKRSIVAPSVFDRSPLLQALQAGDSAEEVWRSLKNDGFTHLYIHHPEAERTRGYEPYQWQAPVLNRWRALKAHYLQLTAADDRQYLYTIRSEPDFSQPVRQGRPLFTYDQQMVASVRPLLQRSLVVAGQGRLAEAGLIWQQLVRALPEWHLPQMYLASLSLMAGRSQEALQRYETADRLGLLSAEAYHQMAMLYLELHRPESARRCLQTALLQDPANPLLRQALERTVAGSTGADR